MHEPSVRTSRLAIAGGLAAVILVGGLGFVLGRSTASPDPQPVATPKPSPVTPEPVVLPALNRGGIIALADRAADAFASGAPLPKAVVEAADRRFEVSLPFGCSGASGGSSRHPFQWQYDEEAGTLRIRVEPSTWLPRDWNLAAGSGGEAIEGFWVTRPWSSSDSCPPTSGHAAAIGAEPVTLPGQTLAMAQFFTSGEGHETRPFELVRRVAAEDFDASRGYRIRLTGRVARVPGNGPVQCVQPAGIEQRPICVVAVRINDIRLENSATGEVLATWDQRARPDARATRP